MPTTAKKKLFDAKFSPSTNTNRRGFNPRARLDQPNHNNDKSKI